MSQFISLVKITPDFLEVVKQNDDVLNAIFHGETPEEIDWPNDAFVSDYAIMHEVFTYRKSRGESVAWMEKATGQTEYGTYLDMEKFYFSIEEVDAIAANLPNEGWDPDDDYDDNIGRFFALASKQRSIVIGSAG